MVKVSYDRYDGILKRLMSRPSLGVVVLAVGLLFCVGRPAAAQDLIVDDNNNNSPFNFSNPARLVNGSLVVGNNSNGEFNQASSSSNISITNDLVIGFLNGSSGSYNLSAGSMTVGDDAFIGDGGDGVLNQTGGSVSVLDALSLGFQPTGAGQGASVCQWIQDPFVQRYDGDLQRTRLLQPSSASPPRASRADAGSGTTSTTPWTTFPSKPLLLSFHSRRLNDGPGLVLPTMKT